MRLVTLADAPGADGQPLFVDFVNTLHWYEGVPVELIGTDAELAAWLAEHNLPARQLAGCLPAFHELRERVRSIIQALAAGRLPLADDVAALNAALAAPAGQLVLVGADTPRPQLAFGAEVSDARLCSFQVALSLATFLEFGDRRRLKLCANAGCGFAFLDTSMNATRRWCDMRYCGNRLKVRAYRGRRHSRATKEAYAP